MFDVCILRNQFMDRLQNWKRSVLLVRFFNIQGREYFKDHEDPERIERFIDIFLTTANSHSYDHKPEGAIRNIQYSCFADYCTDIENNDFIKVDNFLFKVVNLNKVLHPVSGEEIAKSFDLTKLEIEEEDQEEE